MWNKSSQHPEKRVQHLSVDNNSRNTSTEAETPTSIFTFRNKSFLPSAN